VQQGEQITARLNQGSVRAKVVDKT